MECRYFGQCGSCTLFDMPYEKQVEHKKKYCSALFKSLHVKDFEFFTASSSHYRSRAEFRIWHKDGHISYAIGGIEKKQVVCIENCPKVDIKIDVLMSPLLQQIEQNAMLREKLFAIEFLATQNDILVTLIYHKPLSQEWESAALPLESIFNIHIIGRSHKVRRVLSQEFVQDNVVVDGHSYIYEIIEGGFSQPNRAINTHMINWVYQHLTHCKDLLELYCGYGNFTIPLSQKFHKVLATEISKSSIKSALKNCELNKVEHIEFLRMSAEELTSALKKEREFYRLKNIDLDIYTFSHVFVDPPRAGMDEKSLEFISQFETIIYISCNPITLKRDLEFLTQKFTIEHFALFDQFPHTEHIESGVILKKI
ncbi:MAG: tRNA (uridine(54)-C5)-methyltransferase TrmA [Sulfurospirillaceae bacterium]|nr:tRNA (uridine(54)-C5)-methyltransferase TrmA [Sulfurospirillaceae bacterium]